MKNFAKVSAAFGSALLLQAGSASAQSVDNPEGLVGSDTFDGIMELMVPDLLNTPADGITIYLGLGSSSGERQLEGSANSDEPTCGPSDNGGTGCQEIAPMSRQMDSSICDDAESAGNAEGLAVCKDGIVIVTSNATLGQYGDDAASCTAFAALADTGNEGNVFPDNGVGDFGADWDDKLRLIYTGCPADNEDCVAAVPRTERCASAARANLISNWGNLMEGVDCGSGLCPDGLERAYRRDDNSGTTGVFLSFLGVDDSLGSRPSVTASVFSSTVCNPSAPITSRVGIVPIPEDFAFCDGGMFENFAPDCQSPDGVVANVTQCGGDPLRSDCGDDDELCCHDGTGGIVQAILSTPAVEPGDASAYPDRQCARARFGYQTMFTNAAPGVCPDGTTPLGTDCNLPFATVGGSQNFDCVNRDNSAPPSLPLGSVDGRAYNSVRRTASGTVARIVGNLPEVASYRMNMVDINTGFDPTNSGFLYTSGDYVCTESSATRNIGCLTAESDCTIGFAGREAAFSVGSTYDLGNEPVKLDGAPPSDADVAAGDYAAARDLFVNSIGGFENISAECAARGGASDWCDDQLEIATLFYNAGAPGNPVAGLCEGEGFIAIPAARCVGATASAGCGAPTTQALSACEPL